MAGRIEQHRRDRPAGWATVEEAVELSRVLREAPTDAFVVVDCLSLWVSNLMEAGWEGETIEHAARAAADVLSARPSPSVVVSNEVGLGVVPATELGRSYRDVLGRVNAVFAEAADSAQLIVAGRALELDAPPG
jgi:adenosyl cobinamide kinase/adenosyl cobinamide phosphate guanylyltransferase